MTAPKVRRDAALRKARRKAASNAVRVTARRGIRVFTAFAGAIACVMAASMAPDARGAAPPVVVVPSSTTIEATETAGSPFTYSASAIDAFGVAVPVTCAPASGFTFPIAVTTVNCSATDERNKTGTAAFTVTVTDTAGPVVTVPADAVVEATSSSGAPFPFTATANDVVDGTRPVDCVPASGALFGLGATNVVCTASDSRDNTGTASFTVTVVDTTAPALTVPPSTAIEATSASGALFTFSASAADAVDGAVAVTCAPASGSLFPRGATTVDCSATDAAGNAGAAAFTVTVSDTAAPLITVPASTTIAAADASGATYTFSPMALDMVDGVSATTCTPASGSTFAIGATVVNCTSIDGTGNIGTASFTVTVADTEAPLVTVPANATLQSTSASGAPFSYVASATDAIDGPVPVSCAPASGDTFALGATTVTCSATDAAGNTGTGTFTVTVVDGDAPVVTVPASATIEATSVAGAPYSYTATANDLIDGAVAVTCTPASGSTFARGATTVTCNATDSASNTGTGSFTVTVTDTTGPLVTVPADTTVEATSVAGASHTYSASASDLVDGSVAVTCTPASGSTFARGATTVTCNAIDSASNSGTASFTVTVTDTAGPIVTVPANASVEATSGAGASYSYTASANDVVDGTVAVNCVPASGSTFARGATTVTCNATDSASNTGSASFVVTVIDSVAPIVTVPANATVAATSAAGAAYSYTAGATDAIDGTVAVTCSPASGSTFARGATTVTCNATDSASNTGTGSFTVTVVDTDGPIVTVPPNATTEATSVAGAAYTYTASANDLVDGAVAVNCIPASGSTFPRGATTVTCTASDSASNTGSGSFTVTVTDTAGPIVTVPANATVEATSAAGATYNYSASANDVVDGPVPVNCAPASGSNFARGSTTVTCSATDSASNSSSASFSVTVTDTAGPIVTVPANATIEATSAAGATYSYTASASDLVDGPVAVTCTPSSGSTFGLGATTVNCAATDTGSNSGSQSFTVIVVDTAAPALTLPSNATVEATSAAGSAFSFTTAGSDIVDGTVAVSCTPASGATFPLGNTNVSCTAADNRGNSSSGQFTITVSDTTAPAMTLPPNATVEATGANGAAFTFTATSNDAVDGAVVVSCAPASGATFALGTTTVACTATDTRGNRSNGSFTVTTVDTSGPVVTVPASATVDATSAIGATYTYTATATDSVDGELPANCTQASGSTFPFGASTVTCSASDTQGNSSAATFTVTVVDRVGPVITVPASLVAEATSSGGSVVYFSATAVDVVDGAVMVSCTPTSGSMFPLGTKRVSCTAKDSRYNMRGASFNVTVSDTTPPKLTVPTSRTLEATSASGATFTYTTSAVDLVNGARPVTCSRPSGSVFALGANVVTCTATDARNNVGTASFTITVADTIRPTLTVPPSQVVEATNAAGATVSYSVTVNDTVDPAVAVNCSPASGATFPIAATVVSCSAADASGNTASATFDVTVRDTTSPVLTVPPNANLEATGATGASFTYSATATDLVDGALSATCTPASGSTFALGATTVNCTAADARSNNASASFTVTVGDTTGPQLTLPPDGVTEATSAAGATFSYSASASDLVNGNVTVTCAPASGATFPIGATVVNCTAADVAGNTANGTFNVTVRDTTGPALTVPPNATLEATSASGASFTYSATATDAVDGAVTATCTPASGTTFGLGTTTVNCSAADARSNNTSASFTVTVADTAGPHITVPPNATAEATSGAGASFSYSVSAADLVSGNVAVNCTPASGATFAIGATVVSCTAADVAGNTASATFNVTVLDSTGPALTLPANATIEATGASGASFSYSATAADLVDGALSVTCSPASGATFALGATTVSCTATDGRSNSASGSFTVTVADTAGPQITLPPDGMTEATSGTGAAFSYSASASDLVSGTVAVTCAPASGANFPIGATVVNCTAADGAGNIANASFSVTVRDTTGPALTVPPNTTLEAIGASGASFTYGASATDLVDGTVIATCTPASGSTFALGTTTVNCTATDARSNNTSASFTVTVADTTGPQITMPADGVTEATSGTGATFSYSVSGSDLVSGNVTVTCAPASGANFPIGATVVSCSAADGAGNTASGTFSVTVRDTTGPALTVPPNATLEASSASGASFTYSASALDLVDGAVTATCTPASGATFALGTTTVSCTATDARSNNTSASFTITVADTTGPQITLPPNAVTEATSGAGAGFSYSVSASDLVSGTVAVTCAPASGSTFAIGLTTVTCTASDTRGNGAEGSFTVTVRDTTAPAITLPPNATLEATGAGGASFTFVATATDVADGSIAPICIPASGATFPIGTTSVSCTATDTHSNIATASFSVTVRDTTAPVITAPASSTVEATAAAGATYSYTATSTDIVDGNVVVSCTPASGSTFAFGPTTVNCTATDARGNSATPASFIVTVVDTTAPVITVPAPATVEASGPSGAIYSYTATAVDAVNGNVAVSCTPASGGAFALGTTTVNCSATDTRGNTRNVSFTVLVQDTTGPTLELPQNADLTTGDPTGVVFNYQAAAADSVDGGGNAPLVQSNNLIYEGGFRVPDGFFRGPNLTPWQFDRAKFEYGGTAIAFNAANNSLFVVGHDQAQLVAEISIPALKSGVPLASLNTATVLQPFTDFTDLRMALASSDPLNPPDVTVKVGGLLPYQNQLYGSVYIYYDGRSSQKLTLFRSSVNLAPSNDAIGPFEANRPDCDPLTNANCLGAGFFSGYFGRIPFEWQAQLGGPVLNGHCCLGVISRTSYGPALFSMDPAQIGTATPVPAKPLVYYPPAHPLLEPGVEPCTAPGCNPFVDGWSSNSTLFNGSSEVKGVVLPDGTSSVLFLGRHGGLGNRPDLPGGGRFCYGFGTGDPALVGTFPPGEADPYCYDPQDGSKGVHGYPYHYYVWAYNALDLAAVNAGQREPWTVRPYAVWPLSIPIANVGSTRLGGATYDPQSGRIYVSQYQADSNLPVMHAFKLDAIPRQQSVTCTPPSGNKFPVGNTTVNCTARDQAGNETTGSFSVTVTLTDTTPPVVTAPANATIEATGATGASFSFTATATDNVDGPMTPGCAPVSGTTFPIGLTTVVCTATDAHNNTGTASFTVTVRDTTAPTLTAPASTTIEATSGAGAVFTFAVSAVDIVDGNITPVCSRTSGSVFAIGATVVTCTATDTRSNTSSANFTVTVRDSIAPVVTVPASFFVEATGTSGAVVTFTASAVDNIDGARPTVCTPASGATFPFGPTNVTCTATDTSGNTGSNSFTVTVRDITPPTVTVPANATLEATSAAGRVFSYSATASDTVEGGITPTCTPASGSTFPIAITTVSCSASDTRGNTGTATFTVTVADTTGPVVTVPASAIVEASGPAGANFTYTASATDVVDGARAISCTPTGTAFPIAVTTVTCSASDTRGNSSQASFTVTVRDTTPPVVTVPANATISATSGAGAVFAYTASATDIVDGALAVSCSPASGSTFPIGATTVTCSATDTRSNTGNASFTVTVLDGAGPVVTVPANATVEATGPSGAVFTFSATAVDALDGPRPVTCTPASGSTFPLGPTTVACSAVDAQGNPGSATFTVTVVDTTPPNVTVPANTTLEANSAAGTLFTFTATATDLVDGARTVTCTPTSGSVFPMGATTVNCSSSDTRGNVRLAPFTVTVRDTTAPTVTMTAPAQGANVSGGVTASATAADAIGVVGVQFMVDGVPIGLEDTVSPYAVVWDTSKAPNGSHSVFAVVRDAAGNVRPALAMTVNVNNAPGSVQVAVDGNAKRQVVQGFLVNTNSAPWNNGALIPALDMLIDQGASHYRVIVDKMDWEATNDNADPFTFNWAYYNTIYSSPKFEEFWATIAYLNSRGVTNGILLNFMGPGPNWIGAPFVTPGLEDEWVETVASLLYYARFTRGLQFTQVGPSNEVDWDGIEGPRIDQWQYALIIQKLADRLDAIGLSDIQIVGPDTASVVTGVNDYLPQLLGNPRAMSKIQHFGFHNYGDNAAGADAAIKASAYPNRDFWMTEASFGNDYYGVERLMAQLENGAAVVGVWDAYQSDYNHRPDDSVPMIDLIGGQWVPTQAFYVYKQLFKFVPPGATRLQTPNNASVDSIAFFDTVSRRVTVFGHAHTGGTVRISLTNLPMVSSYQLYLTSHVQQFEQQADVTLVNGVATIEVDGDGYFTLTGLAAPLTDTAPPTVTMTSPANGSTVVGNITLAAAATDDVAVAGVQFQLDGVNLGAEITSPPFTTSWNSMNASNGAHVLMAVARDSSGKTTTSAGVSITISNDLTPPTVAITTPVHGASVSGTAVALIASASDNVGVVGVQFRLNGANFGAEITTPPYTVTWNTTLQPNGPYTWTAVARDAAGNSTTSAAITANVNNLVDTTPPTASVTAPLAGATVTGSTVTLSANASDNVGVLGVQFLVDGVAVGAEDTSAPYSITWDSTSVPNGAHTISARARDAAGLQGTSAGVSVTVSNTAAPATLAVDAQVFGNVEDRVTSVTSPAFSTTSTGELVVVFLAFDDLTPGNGTTSVTGGGLTWTLVARNNARRGGVEVWRAVAANRLTNATVTATITQPTPASIGVVTFTGADTTGTNGSNGITATTRSGTASLTPANVPVTTTRANSWVWGVGNDWDGATARTVGTGMTKLHELLYWGGATFWIERRTTTTPTVGSSAPIGTTAPNSREWNMIAVEIKPRP